MNFVLLAVLLVMLWGLRLRKDNRHLSKDQTCAINGLFVLLVFLRHTVDYIPMGRWDGIFAHINKELDQLIVVPFLFYSGYGIMRSIQSKGKSYVRSIPKNRIFKVWYHFAIAVGLYWVLSLFLHKNYAPLRVALSFTGWDSIGNSNWYIFATLWMYVFTWLAFTLLPKRQTLAAAVTAALCVGYILVLQDLKGIWWYDTALVYPAGMLYGLYGEKLEKHLTGVLPRLLALMVCIGLFALSFYLQEILFFREAMAVFFALLVVCITMLVKISNPVLLFLGKYTFEIYILQRIPMLLLKNHFSNPYLYLAAGFAASLLVAVGFHKLLEWLDGIIYLRRRKQL
jgi:membrane-bound acyltransferase YfiQ involved in biofilm formation